MEMARRRRRAAYQKKKQNRVALVLVTAVLFMLIAIVTVKGSQLKTQQAAYQAQEKELQTKIDSEKQRSADLKEYSKYTQTDKFYADVAKEKLGLVYQDEIVFESEENK